MRIRVKLSPTAYKPERAHDTDSGADIRTPEGFVLRAHSGEIVCTGVHVELPYGHDAEIKSKSGLNIKHDVTTYGLIDVGFSGEIIVKLYNRGDHDYRFERGDKIAQLVVRPVDYPDFEVVDEIEGGERGTDGYGSTGR